MPSSASSSCLPGAVLALTGEELVGGREDSDAADGVEGYTLLRRPELGHLPGRTTGASPDLSRTACPILRRKVE